MAAPSERYVDPSIAGDSGAGTIGDPWGDLQYGLNQVTRDATNGDRFNIKAGTAEVLTGQLSLATYGTPDLNAPLIFQGYTSAAGDGGQGDLNGNAGNFQINPSGSHIYFVDLITRNTGSALILNISSYSAALRCYVHTNTNAELMRLSGTQSQILHSRIECQGQGLVLTSTAKVIGNYFTHTDAGSNKRCIQMSTFNGGVIHRNIFSIGSAAVDVLYVAERGYRISNNSILASSSTGSGVHVVASNGDGIELLANLIEGFSGTGGTGVKVAAGGHIGLYGKNAFYNNATHESGLSSDGYFINEGDNETLSASPFAKSGSDTFANRFTYFAPVDTGNVIGGAYQ